MAKAKPIKITQFVRDGEFDTTYITDTDQLLRDAGTKLDAANASDITGPVLFRGRDGKFYVGTVEFLIEPVNPTHLVQTLTDNNYCECQNCGHLEDENFLGQIKDFGQRVAPGEPSPAGECTKCHALSHLVSRERALEIAGIKKPKKQRRGGLK